MQTVNQRFVMDKKRLSSCLKKYDFHHTNALEENAAACRYLETIIIELLKERKIPDNEVTPFEIGDRHFVFVYLSDGQLNFRYPCDDFEEGYYDSYGLYDFNSSWEMLRLIELLTGKQFTDLLK